MQRIGVLGLLTTCLLSVGGLAACGSTEGELGDVDDGARDTLGDEVLSVSDAELAADSSLRARIVAYLKGRIREISLANQTRVDNTAAVTAELRPYVELLARLAPPRSDAQTLELLQGPWYSLWTNQEFRGFVPDLARVFQVVREGHYYNVSNFTGPGGAPIVNVLRGAYAPLTDGDVAIRFTRNGFLPGTLIGKTGAQVAALAAAVESGAQPITEVPGPIGITGVLGTVYVDDTLRIADGTQTPVFDDQGQVTVPGQFGLLFVLERLDGTLP
jgi:PAP_fibrillin